MSTSLTLGPGMTLCSLGIGVCLLWLLQARHSCIIRSPIGDTPPYAMANTFLAQFTVTTDGQWNCCDSCKSTAKPYAVFMSPSYQRSLLNCSAFQQQFLSVPDCRADIAKRYHGFADAQYISESLLEHPLIADPGLCCKCSCKGTVLCSTTSLCLRCLP